jgi:hypothetical protein
VNNDRIDRFPSLVIAKTILPTQAAGRISDGVMVLWPRIRDHTESIHKYAW